MGVSDLWTRVSRIIEADALYDLRGHKKLQSPEGPPDPEHLGKVASGDCHYHPYTGLPCSCFWGEYYHRHPKPHLAKTAGQQLNKVLKAPGKAANTPEGARYLEYLQTLPDEYDSLAPYLWQRFKKGDITLNRDAPSPDDLGQLEYIAGTQRGSNPSPDGGAAYYEEPIWRNALERLPQWHQWFEARQHPTRQGVNVMDPNFTPKTLQTHVDDHQRALNDALKKQRWIERYAHDQKPVHEFGPEVGSKHKGWTVNQLDAKQAEGCSEIMNNICIGKDAHPYKHNIDNGTINAYSLNDHEGVPHVCWHFNPDGQDIGHMQGNSGNPNEKYRHMMTLFHEAKGYPDEEGPEESLEEDPGEYEYDLESPMTPDDLVSQYKNPYEWVPDDVTIAEDGNVNMGSPDWDQIASYYLRRTRNTSDDFFRTVDDMGSGRDFAQALEANMDLTDENQRQLVEEWNRETRDGGAEVELPDPRHNEVDKYNAAIANGEEPNVTDWDEMAKDYLGFTKGYVEDRHADGVNYSPRGYGESYKPGEANHFHWNLQSDGTHKYVPHADQMGQALQRNVNWEDPSHQIAVQTWNNGMPQHNIFPPQESDRIAPILWGDGKQMQLMDTSQWGGWRYWPQDAEFEDRMAQAHVKLAHPLYKRWVFSPASGQVSFSDNSEDPMNVKYHTDMARELNEPNLQHGFAYRIGDGWRLTDWESKPLTDAYVIASVMGGLRSQNGSDKAQNGSQNAWEPEYGDDDWDWDRMHTGAPGS